MHQTKLRNKRFDISVLTLNENSIEYLILFFYDA